MDMPPDVVVQKKLEDGAWTGDLELVKAMVGKGASPMGNNSLPLLMSVQGHHMECFDFLLEFCTDRIANAWSLRTAALHGFADMVEKLIPVSDMKSDNYESLVMASKAGYADCVRLLSPVSDLSVSGYQALKLAIINGHVDCAKELFLDVPGSGAYEFLKIAAQHGRPKMLSYFLSEADYDEGQKQGAFWVSAYFRNRSCVEVMMDVLPMEYVMGSRDSFSMSDDFDAVQIIDSVIQERKLRASHSLPAGVLKQNRQGL